MPERVKRMEPVLRLAELEVDKAGRQLAQAQQRLQQEELKQRQLQDYQQDYRQRLLAAGQQGMTVDRLRLFDGFQQQLEKAVQQQKSMIIARQRDVDTLRQHWQQLDIRHKSLQKMLERLQREADAKLARIEQRNHDEYARRRPSNSGW